MKWLLYCNILMMIPLFSGCDSSENNNDTGTYRIYKEYLVDAYLEVEKMYVRQLNATTLELYFSGKKYGMQSQGVSSTLKHFPGQGQCGEDTHKGYVDLNATIDRLREVEFLPFESGIAAGADMVMMSHVAVSQVTGKETPASLTKLMVTDILREELQFNNVIITDAMNMKVITKFYDADQAAVMAVQAGNDMILMPDNFEQAFEGVLEAVKDGTISESKINEAVSRILSVKIRRGILPTDSKLFRHNAGK